LNNDRDVDLTTNTFEQFFGHKGRNRFREDLEAVEQQWKNMKTTPVSASARITISLNEFECWTNPGSSPSTTDS